MVKQCEVKIPRTYEKAKGKKGKKGDKGKKGKKGTKKGTKKSGKTAPPVQYYPEQTEEEDHDPEQTEEEEEGKNLLGEVRGEPLLRAISAP